MDLGIDYDDYDDDYYCESTINRYSDVVPYEDRKYWYFTTHGVQPGSIPRGVNVLDIVDTLHGTYVCLDAILNTSELKYYDMKEKSPSDEELNESAKPPVNSMTDLVFAFDLEDEEMLNESYLIESQAEDSFRNRFGDSLTNRFNALRNQNKLRGVDADYGKYMRMSVDEVEQAITDAENTQSRKEVDKLAKEGAALIHSDDEWNVYHITNFEASQKYGKGSKWCITGTDTSGNTNAYGNRYWNSYTENGIQFYFYINKLRKDEEGREVKFALALSPNGTYELFNATDDPIQYIPNGPNGLTDDEGRTIPNVGKKVYIIDINYSTAQLASKKQTLTYARYAKSDFWVPGDSRETDTRAFVYDSTSNISGMDSKRAQHVFAFTVTVQDDLFQLGMSIGNKVPVHRFTFTVIGKNLIAAKTRSTFDNIESRLDDIRRSQMEYFEIEKK
jgi:hypothetical protein